MARAKVNIGGQNIKLTKAQAMQQGMIDPVTGMATSPAPGQPGGGSMGVYQGGQSTSGAMTQPMPTPTNPQKQTQMFGTVQTASKLNPAQDIMNMDPNEWKKLQKKFGIQEV